MTFRRSHTCTQLPAFLAPRSWSRICGMALSVALAGGCGGQSSTDTGNPPIVLGQKLRLTATASGVIVTGDPGAVPGGARVDVVNTATGQSATATAEADGSFEIEVEGSAADEYRVYAASGGQSWRLRLTSSGAGAAESGLEGLEFLLESARGYTPVPGTSIRLSFTGGSPGEERGLSFHAGCNSHFGSYSLCEGKLCVSELGGTEIGCDPARHAQDAWVSEFLRSAPRLTQAGAALTLEGAEATLEFLDREVADPDRPLTGRSWTIDTFFSNGAASNVPSPVPPTLQFGADGVLSVFTTCNTGGGNYTRSGQTLVLSGVAYTEEGCGETGNVTVEQNIQRVIREGEVSFEIEAARLTITRGTEGLGAITE